MTDGVKLSIISTAEGALSKLKKAKIAVFDCKKEGASFIFCVNDKDVEKAFAIFDNPCYNIKVVKRSRFQRLLSFMGLRAGLLAGVIAFIVLAVLSDTFVLKIEVSGSGSYLEPEIRKIIVDEGAGEFKNYSSFNAATATGRILALPQVTFCNIEKRGSVLFVDVQTDEENYGTVNPKALVSDVDGVIKSIVAICGTAACSVGDGVKKGDVLIYAKTLSGEDYIDCLAVGYAEIECRGTAEYFAETDSEESLKQAYSSIMLEKEQIVDRKHTVKPTEGGVLHKVSINLS